MTALLASLHRRVTGAFIHSNHPRRSCPSFASCAGSATRTKHAYFGAAPIGTSRHCRKLRTHSTVWDRPLFLAMSSDDETGVLLSSPACASRKGYVTTTQQQQRQQLESSAPSQWSQYEQLVRKLYMTNLFNPVKLGLENMDRLHEMIGRPMDQPNISVVHIAGSNGKGSVALKTAHTLHTQANYKVGLFVSPHISSFRERIQINGVPIEEDQVVQYLGEIFDICESQQIPATFFEVTTALAFRVFAAENVDVVVLETGLGGRLDATNVIRRPALCIITSIGLEHTRILGDTIELIAKEKAGILKENCPVLIGKSVPLEVIKECAAEKKAADIYRCEDLLGVETTASSSTSTSSGTTPLEEDYDIENSKMTKAALILLQFHLANMSLEKGKQPHIITPEEMDEGVKIRPPCRFEEMDVAIPMSSVIDNSDASSTTVRVVLDVAHNPQAMEYLISKLTATYPNLNPTRDVRMVVGMSADKDLKQCTDILLDYLGGDASKVHLVEASHPRAASVEKILEANPILKEAYHSRHDNDAMQHSEENDSPSLSSPVASQVRQALTLAASNNELLVICGSVFIMADAREELGIFEPRDSAVIAAVAGAGLRSSQENFGEGSKK
ncbi:hypothetical protein HJC23_006023 [Cyclotella cryptica]|uniref:Mur ligase C-terminal domain-containing protein n=1 Tax=Cyclotella cryptica TaxID=29204 RepID=A0ABD3NTU0_9STRA